MTEEYFKQSMGRIRLLMWIAAVCFVGAGLAFAAIPKQGFWSFVAVLILSALAGLCYEGIDKKVREGHL